MPRDGVWVVGVCDCLDCLGADVIDESFGCARNVSKQGRNYRPLSTCVCDPQTPTHTHSPTHSQVALPPPAAMDAATVAAMMCFARDCLVKATSKDMNRHEHLVSVATMTTAIGVLETEVPLPHFGLLLFVVRRFKSSGMSREEAIDQLEFFDKVVHPIVTPPASATPTPAPTAAASVPHRGPAVKLDTPRISVRHHASQAAGASRHTLAARMVRKNQRMVGKNRFVVKIKLINP